MVSAPSGAAPSAFEFTGGALCLDFTNTVSRRRAPSPRERLQGYGDLVRWASAAGTLQAREGGRLARDAVQRPREARATLARGIRLREALYRVFSAVVAGRHPDRTSLAVINTELPSILAHGSIERRKDRFVWTWDRTPGTLDSLLWPIAWSALELLTSPAELERVRECAAAGCSWLFLDASRNRTRRWCDMKVCGNRNKVRCFRTRHQ